MWLQGQWTNQLADLTLFTLADLYTSYFCCLNGMQYLPTYHYQSKQIQQIPSVDRDEINRQERISSNGNYWAVEVPSLEEMLAGEGPELPIRGFRVGQAKPNRHHSLVRLNWYACIILLVRLSKCAHRNPEIYHRDSWHLGRARQRS